MGCLGCFRGPPAAPPEKQPKVVESRQDAETEVEDSNVFVLKRVSVPGLVSSGLPMATPARCPNRREAAPACLVASDDVLHCTRVKIAVICGWRALTPVPRVFHNDS